MPRAGKTAVNIMLFWVLKECVTIPLKDQVGEPYAYSAAKYL